jgi:NitT/TauT family transport system ATP-binding protein
MATLELQREKLIVARQVGKRFASRVEALADIDLELAGGEFVSIVGPSGCGKSSLLRLIAGLSAPTTGSLTVAGKPPGEARGRLQEIAYVFQEATLLPWRTVAENVALPLLLRHQEDADRVARTLEMVGLADFARAYPRQLSGGMRMRVSIARALVTRPGLLLMDEPFGALDEITRQRLNEELLRLWEQDRWTVVFVTHNVSEAVFLSQRVLVMSARPGRLIADIAVPFAHPRSPELRTEPGFNRIAEETSRQLRSTGAP